MADKGLVNIVIETKILLADEKQAIGFGNLGTRGGIVGEYWLRRWCFQGYVRDSGDGEVRGGSDGQREVTI